VQNEFSLIEQGDRQTVFPLCHEHGIGYTPHGPLAGGWLTGKYRRDEAPPRGSRMTLRPEGKEHYWSNGTLDALHALEREAEERGVSMAALALAWLLRVPEVTAVVVGPNTVEQLPPVVEALGIDLGEDGPARIGRLFA
jgi:aryl-alcohol dehydrogenase-like predicted oxidoreductase